MCVDVDGVLAKYGGNYVEGSIGAPLPGAREFLKQLTDMGYAVVLHSSRASAIVESWATQHGLVNLVAKFTDNKPPAVAYIDDRGIQFTGDYSDALQAVRDMKPWWKQQEEAAEDGVPLPILLMTVGLPRSGKSTWAKAQGYPIVNPDAIRLALHGQAFYGDAEPFVWAIAKTMVTSLFLAGHNTVILDATNITAKRRDEWRSSKWSRNYQTFDTSVEVCNARAVATKREDLIPVIARMAEAYEPVGGMYA